MTPDPCERSLNMLRAERDRLEAECDALAQRLPAFAVHLPAVLDALTIRLREAEDPANRKRYRAALDAAEALDGYLAGLLATLQMEGQL